VVKQLSGIGGGRPLGFGVQRVLSLPDGVAQVLSDYLDRTGEQASTSATNGTPQRNGRADGGHSEQRQPSLKIGDLCPECGEASLLNEEGCRTCASCGYSEC
jgi:ribonucleoside-diphosphate reductase alpha chain